MILFIDTTVWGKIRFALIDTEKQKILELNKDLPHAESNKMLRLLDGFINKNKEQISKIVVCSGPGSFTGTRVGVAITLGYSFGLNIPVVTLLARQVPTDLLGLKRIKTTQFRIEYSRPAVD